MPETASGNWRKRLLLGSGGIFAGHFLNRGLAVIQMSLFAHLFAPELLGFFLFVATIVSGYSVLAEGGLRSYVIKYRGESFEDVLHTSVFVQSCVSSVVVVLVLLSSPLLEMAFNDDRLPLFVSLTSAMILLPVFLMMTAEWERELKFFRISFAETIQLSVAITLTTICYFVELGLWSLFIGYLTGFFCRALYIVMKSESRFRFDFPKREMVRQVWRFSLPMLVASAFGFVSLKGDDILVKFFWGDEAFGLYVAAFYIPFILLELVGLMTRVTFPLLADRHADRDALARAFSLINQYISAIALPSGVLLYLMAEPIVLLFFGAAWREAIPAMELFALAFILRACTGLNWTSIALAKERTRYLMWVSVATAIFLLLVGAPLIREYGVMGGAYYSLIQLGVMGPLVRLPLLKQELGSIRFLADCWPVYLSGIATFMVVWLMLPQWGIYLSALFFAVVYPVLLRLFATGLFAHWKEFLAMAKERRSGGRDASPDLETS